MDHLGTPCMPRLVSSVRWQVQDGTSCRAPRAVWVAAADSIRHGGYCFPTTMFQGHVAWCSFSPARALRPSCSMAGTASCCIAVLPCMHSAATASRQKFLASAPTPQLSCSSTAGACSTVLTRLRASGTGAAERSVGGQLGAPSRGRAERNVPPGCTAQERRHQSCARELWRPPVPPLSEALPHGAILTAVKPCLSIWAQSSAAGACIALSRLLVVLLRAIVMYKCLGGKDSFDWPRGGENQPSANTYPTQ